MKHQLCTISYGQGTRARVRSFGTCGVQARSRGCVAHGRCVCVLFVDYLTNVTHLLASCVFDVSVHAFPKHFLVAPCSKSRVAAASVPSSSGAAHGLIWRGSGMMTHNRTCLVMCATEVVRSELMTLTRMRNIVHRGLRVTVASVGTIELPELHPRRPRRVARRLCSV